MHRIIIKQLKVIQNGQHSEIVELKHTLADTEKEVIRLNKAIEYRNKLIDRYHPRGCDSL